MCQVNRGPACLTFRWVRYKPSPEIFPRQVPSFNQIKKEDLRWSIVIQKAPLLQTDGERGFVLCGAGK